jgi:hypothetical protein
MAITKLPRSGIADNSINASKIEDGTVAIAEVSGTISNAKLVNSTIANAKLSNSTITVRGTSRALGTSFSIGVDVDWQSIVVSDGSTVTTMAAGKGYFVNNTSAAGIVKLPAAASIGDTIAIKDYAGNFGTNNLTIQRNGHNIQGVVNDSLISTNRASVVLVYVDSTKGWLYTNEHNVADLVKYVVATGGTVTTSGNFKIHKFTGDGNFVVTSSGIVDYLVVGGGGSGGVGSSDLGGSGGGAGGYRESHSAPISGPYTASPLATPTSLSVSAQTYPITIGAGGTSSSGNSYPGVNSGSNSSFSTITSHGGGHGSNFYMDQPPGRITGAAGGSGGGSGYGASAGSGNTPPVSPPQGNSGGTWIYPAKVGGGGGAGAVGGNGNPGTACTGGNSGAGGAGTYTEIVGTCTGYAGGGGGAGGGYPYFNVSAGAGGAGGGGAGGAGGSNAGTAGTANTGSGGGGRGSTKTYSNPANLSGANGGSGIVIIRYKYQ